MSACPHCHGPVDPQVQAVGRCPHCGQPLAAASTPAADDELKTLASGVVPMPGALDPPPAEDELKTLASGAVPALNPAELKTLDSGSVPELNPAELKTLASGAVPELGPADLKTLDSGSVSKLGAGELQATIDSKSGFSPAQIARVSRVWGLSQTPTGNPLKTIKASDAAYANKSTLVIKTRAFRRTHDVEAGGADYELLELIGKGGMGVVYAARQASIDREVAVKMLNAETAADVMQRFKFLSEAVVTGELDHPNIVPIHDLGANEAGALFYSMKRVRGTPWMEVLGQKPRAENLDILMKVADAVAFAHSRGVIHRDLKPENVMLGGFGEVLVMDWGLALAAPGFSKANSITQSNSMGGTPAYMAPEMATGPIEKVGPASDVYLLGACLFEIIAGKPPHTGSNVMNCLYAAACNKIVPVEANGELMDIARKAMATEPADRYASVQEFQAAIREYQSHSESILLSSRAEQDLARARQTDQYQDFARVVFGYEEALALWPGNAQAQSGAPQARLAYAESALRKGDYDLGLSLLDAEDPAHAELRAQILAAQQEREERQHRLTRLRRTAGAMAAAIFVLVTSALGVVAVLYNDAQVQRTKAEKANTDLAASYKNLAEAKDLAVRNATEAQFQKTKADEARQREEHKGYVSKIGLAAAQIEGNGFGLAQDLLADCPAQRRRWEWGRLSYLCSQGRDTLSGDGRLESLAVSPDGQFVATAAADGEVQLWNLAGRTPQGMPLQHRGRVHAVLFTADGRFAISAGGDSPRQLKFWNCQTGALAAAVSCGEGTILAAAQSRDGRWLAAGLSDGRVLLWQLRPAGDAPEVALSREAAVHGGPIWSLAFVPAAQPERAASNADQPAELVVTGGDDGTAAVLDFRAAEFRWPYPTFRRHGGPIYAVAASPTGGLVATAGADERILLWNPADVRQTDYKAVLAGTAAETPLVAQFTAHQAEIRGLAFSTDGTRLASAGHDNTVRVWDLERKAQATTLRGHAGWVRCCRYLPAGHELVSCGYDGQTLHWHVADYRESIRLERSDDPSPVLSAGFSPDGTEAVTAHADGVAVTWDAHSGRPVSKLEEGHEFLGERALFFPDGRRLLTAARDSTIRLWNLEAGYELRPLGEPLRYSENIGQTLALALSPDGTRLAAAGDDNAVLVWEASTFKPLHVLRGHAEQVSALAFSADGKLLFSGDVYGRGRLWDAQRGEHLRPLDGHTRQITGAAFLPADRGLLTSSLDRSIGRWDVTSGRERKERMLRHPHRVSGFAVSADGQVVVSGCEDGVVRVWSAESATLERTLAGRFQNLTAVALSPNGSLAATVEARTDRGAPVRLWDVASGNEIPVVPANGGPASRLDYGAPWSAAFSHDGRHLLTIGNRQARLWDPAAGRLLMTYRPHAAVSSAQFSRSDRRQVVTASVDRTAKLWSTASALAEGGKLIGEHDHPLTYAEFSPDGQKIVTCDTSGKVVIWDRATRKKLVSHQAHTAAVHRAVFSPEGERLLTASADSTARVWRVEADRLVQQLELTGHELGVLAGAFSADGQRIVTGGEDNSARVWSAADGAPLATLVGHTASVTAVTFSPDGARVLTGSQDTTAKLWDPTVAEAERAQGSELLTLSGHTQEVTSVAFSPDGRQALTGSRDGTAIIWPADDWRAAPRPSIAGR